MKWIVGLGNPGPRYDGTPHNLGFRVVDELAGRWAAAWRMTARARALVAEVNAGTPLRLVKPLTYMNLSGEAVAALMRQQAAAPDELLIVTDDVNLPIGRLRIRSGGSHGGHNGLRSVIERLGSGEFGRLRIGIQPRDAVDDLVEYVLRKPPPLEREQMAEMVPFAAEAAQEWLARGWRAAAEKFNGLRRFDADDEPETR